VRRVASVPLANRLEFGGVQLFPGHVHRVVNVPLVNRFVTVMIQLTPGHVHCIVHAPVVNLSNYGVVEFGLVQLAPGHEHWVVYAPVANRLELDKVVWVPQRLGSMVRLQN